MGGNVLVMRGNVQGHELSIDLDGLLRLPCNFKFRSCVHRPRKRSVRLRMRRTPVEMLRLQIRTRVVNAVLNLEDFNQGASNILDVLAPWLELRITYFRGSSIQKIGCKFQPQMY